MVGFVVMEAGHTGSAGGRHGWATRFAASTRPRQAGTWLLVAAVASADLISGTWARAHLAPLTETTSWLRFGWVTNRGVAFGIGAGHPGWAAAASAVLVLVLVTWLLGARPPLQRTGLSLALGGGLGNLIDRVGAGSVTDWIHVTGYPATFNLADVAIRLGLLLVLVDLLVTGRRPRHCLAQLDQP